jgi:hypothetical protein
MVTRKSQVRGILRGAAGAVLVLAVLAGGYAMLVHRPTLAAAVPPPIGGPDIAQDVNTMLGKRGPGFTLRDGDGRAYTIAPGGTNRPLVIISHMGFF